MGRHHTINDDYTSAEPERRRSFHLLSSISSDSKVDAPLSVICERQRVLLTQHAASSKSYLHRDKAFDTHRCLNPFYYSDLWKRLYDTYTCSLNLATIGFHSMLVLHAIAFQVRYTTLDGDEKKFFHTTKTLPRHIELTNQHRFS